MISSGQALEHLFALAPIVGTEDVTLAEAAGRILAADMVATRAQPPFAASAMDGYAVRHADAQSGQALRVIGEALAGRAFQGAVGPGEAVRIFTGAPVPDGADCVVIQEDTARSGDDVTLCIDPDSNRNIRPAGGDFLAGDRVSAPRRLSPSDIALAASMNLPVLTVRRRPVVSIIATGNELVQPGEIPAVDQIIASNALGLKALFEAEGATARLLPIARDNLASLRAVFDLAQPADLVVTIGGASVGDHDLVGAAARELGLDQAFYKVAMRPGKPLMAGRLRGAPLVGLPGNPVSAMVCGHVFIIPMLRAMLGFQAQPRPRTPIPIACDLPANGPREHYMRAIADADAIRPFSSQDSSLLSILSQANALLVRPPDDPTRSIGDVVEMISLSSL